METNAGIVSLVLNVRADELYYKSLHSIFDSGLPEATAASVRFLFNGKLTLTLMRV